MHLTNIHGLWALLAVPVIILIHCLQEKSRRLRVSTLFLLDRVSPESVSGSRMERFRQSLPFWMQILAALLLTWMLIEPRWTKKDSSQSVVVVLDSSASMSAYQTEARSALESTLGKWARNAARTRWHLIETDPRKPTLYAGEHLDELMVGLQRWHPVKGSHDASDAFLTARRLIKEGHGVIIHVTDRKVELPSDIALLAVGMPKENVGWSGVDVTPEMKWKTLVTNHSEHVQQREWWVENEKSPQPAKNAITLQPGQTLALSGELPGDVSRATLVLSADALELDDRVPMLRPEPRPVRVVVHVGGESGELLKKMIGALDGVVFGALGETADLTLAEIGENAETDGIYIDSPLPEAAKLDASLVVAENHPLTRDANWTGLLCPKPRALAVLESDSPLLWRGNDVLALVRKTSTATGRKVQQLLLNWDLSKSNAKRLPALLVMLHRYVEQVRTQLEGERAENYETAQRISLPESVSVEKLVLRVGKTERPFIGLAPETPEFFEVRRGEEVLVRGASHFADVREADLSKGESFDGTAMRRQETVLRETEADPLTPVWLLAVLGCLVTAWSSRK